MDFFSELIDVCKKNLNFAMSELLLKALLGRGGQAHIHRKA